MDEQELARLRERLCAAEDAALTEAIELYEVSIRRFISFRVDARLSSRLDPSDIFQDFYLAARSRLQHFSKAHSLSPLGWLRQIAGQTIIDLERRHLGADCRSLARERSPTGFDFASSTCDSLASLLAGNATSPSQVALRNERAARIREKLTEMNEIDREVIAMRHFEELSNDEVADVLQITKAGASNRYVRAMGRLAALAG